MKRTFVQIITTFTCLAFLSSCSTQLATANYSSPASSNYLMDDAFDHYNAGNYYNAFQIIKPLANDGNAKAQWFLGAWYADGIYVKQSYKNAAYWYEKSAEQDFKAAQFDLGYLYAKGKGVTQSYKAAAYWYKKAANQGEARAQSSLAILYIEGYGVAKNLEQSVYWFQKSAQQGNSSAQYSLGQSYYMGRGTNKDFNKAKYWLTKAKNNNDKIAAKYATNLIDEINNMSWLEKSGSNWWSKQKKGASSFLEIITGD